jgi:UTP--glucose-1-phosphate uridylyltransferase
MLPGLRRNVDPWSFLRAQRALRSQPMTVRAALIPAAGLGTRFLPATKAVPKELLPIVDVPALQLVIDEAVGAGIDHVVLVSNRAKPAIEAYVTPSTMVVDQLRAKGRHELADRVERIGDTVRISIAYQDEPRGLGHAVGCGREAIGDQPFAVLLPDELMSEPSLLAQMGTVCENTGGSVVALKQVPKDKVSAYGVVAPAGPMDDQGVVPIVTMVEKPPVDSAPSDMIIIGRYVLTPDVFDEIARLTPGAGGELQLTDALKVQASRSPFHGVLSTIGRADTGTPLGWLEAVVDAALADAAVADGFTALLRARLGDR